MLTVSDFQILIKSCSIESRNDASPKSEVVHVDANFVKNARNVRFVLFTKTSNVSYRTVIYEKEVLSLSIVINRKHLTPRSILMVLKRDLHTNIKILSYLLYTYLI